MGIRWPIYGPKKKKWDMRWPYPSTPEQVGKCSSLIGN
jgi:hypothetical protein